MTETKQAEQQEQYDHCPHCGCIVERDDVSGELCCAECAATFHEDELVSVKGDWLLSVDGKLETFANAQPAKLVSVSDPANVLNVSAYPGVVEALDKMLRNAIILSDSYLHTFRGYKDTDTLQGWLAGDWRKLAATAKSARTILSAVHPAEGGKT